MDARDSGMNRALTGVVRMATELFKKNRSFGLSSQGELMGTLAPLRREPLHFPEEGQQFWPN